MKEFIKSESLTKLIPAVIQVMAEVKGVEKNLKVGTGDSSYKGVADKDVKKAIGEAMTRNGLSIFPIGINEQTDIFRWEEMDTYKKVMKTKQSIVTKVNTDYLLVHSSGEFIQLVGFGIGIDSGDKSPGKATTYALKNTLLYTFMVPTGTIDDSDNSHSDELPVPKDELPAPKKVIAPAKAVINPELEDALFNVENANTVDVLQGVWDGYEKLHKDKKFVDAVKARKIQLLKPITQ